MCREVVRPSVPVMSQIQLNVSNSIKIQIHVNGLLQHNIQFNADSDGRSHCIATRSWRSHRSHLHGIDKDVRLWHFALSQSKAPIHR